MGVWGTECTTDLMWMVKYIFVTVLKELKYEHLNRKKLRILNTEG